VKEGIVKLIETAKKILNGYIKFVKSQKLKHGIGYKV